MQGQVLAVNSAHEATREQPVRSLTDLACRTSEQTLSLSPNESPPDLQGPASVQGDLSMGRSDKSENFNPIQGDWVRLHR